jgi:hypothetical protein
MTEKEISEMLRKAVAARVAAIRNAPAAEGGHSYSISCPGCKATIELSEDDLEQYKTDDETSQTDGDPDESLDGDDPDPDDDEPDNDDDPEDRASALAKRLLRAASKPTK